MVRAPCCEKMGLKKGPWTPEEDQILISYIQQHGHGNWRALPKQAGLLRCGKSCRLRWTNYLRPDIKRGNFSKEEEDTIINLHELLGNRWSAIAAKLPGRTDNEIKNVWHTHLKKKLKNYDDQTSQGTKSHHHHHRPNAAPKSDSKAPPPSRPAHDDDTLLMATNFINQQEVHSPVVSSPQQSSSEMSSVTDSSAMTTGCTTATMTAANDNTVIKQEEMDSYETDYLPPIDESFWSDELSSDNSNQHSDFAQDLELQFQIPLSPINVTTSEAYSPKTDEGMDFWYDLFIRAGDLPDLPDF